MSEAGNNGSPSSMLDEWLALSNSEFASRVQGVKAFEQSLGGKRRAQRAVEEAIAALEEMYAAKSRAGRRPARV